MKSEITVRERNSLTSNFSDPGELPTAVDPRDLGNIKRVVIDVSRLKPRSRVTIVAEGSALRNAMEFTVSGEDRTRVEGLMRRLDDRLAPRERLSLLLSRYGWLTSASPLFLIGFIVVVVVVLLLKYAFGVSPETSIPVAAGAGGALALAAGLLAWVSPTLEVLPPARKPKFQRWRAKVLTVVGALFVGVIGSVIATVIYSGE